MVGEITRGCAFYVSCVECTPSCYILSLKRYINAKRDRMALMLLLLYIFARLLFCSILYELEFVEGVSCFHAKREGT